MDAEASAEPAANTSLPAMIVNARAGPLGFPVVEVRLRISQRLEAEALQLALSVSHAGLGLAFAIGIAHATRDRRDAVVREHVAIERVERGVVDVWLQHALAQVVEHDDAWRATKAAEGFFVQLAR